MSHVANLVTKRLKITKPTVPFVVLHVDVDAVHREQHLDDVNLAPIGGEMERGPPGADRAGRIAPAPNAATCMRLHAATCMRLHAHAACGNMPTMHADDCCHHARKGIGIKQG